jgi:hypothetical protein
MAGHGIFPARYGIHFLPMQIGLQGYDKKVFEIIKGPGSKILGPII